MLAEKQHHAADGQRRNKKVDAEVLATIHAGVAILPCIQSASNATRLDPSEHRRQVNRLLNLKSGITLSSLQRTAAMVGRRRMTELV